MSHAFIAAFSAKIEVACNQVHRNCGLSDVLFDARSHEACEGLLESVLAELYGQALAIAEAQGYDPDYEPDHDVGPGACSMTGIDEACCSCGRHP